VVHAAFKMGADGQLPFMENFHHSLVVEQHIGRKPFQASFLGEADENAVKLGSYSERLLILIHHKDQLDQQAARNAEVAAFGYDASLPLEMMP
jgi:hypothetical protein